MNRRQPEYDSYNYITENGLLQCPWCGESFCGDSCIPLEGSYITSTGREVRFPPEPHKSDERAYCPECYKEKMAEKHSAENQSLGDFL